MAIGLRPRDSSRAGRPLGRTLLVALLAGAALLLGLTGATLRTGRIAPLDWLLPGAMVIVLIWLLAAWRGRAPRWRDAIWIWSLVAVPAGLFCLLAGIGRPWLAVALLGAGLALIAFGVAGAFRLASVGRWLVLGGLLAAAGLAPHVVATWRNVDKAPQVRPVIGVMAGVPLQGVPLGAVQGIAPREAIGLRSPLWQMLETRAHPRALDTLDAASLDGLEALLLIQPRQLAPVELVALDRWVRSGGRAVILADPLLRWSDSLPLGHPARAPLTSLLDPLLAHWGLRLEPAAIASEGEGEDGDRVLVERRRLASGQMLHLVAASRFVMQGAGSCALHDAGLIARCRIGRGAALLIADADWSDDALWTLDPDEPADRGAWTSDAVDVLNDWLRGEAPRLGGWEAWLKDRAALLRALRLALAALLALVVLERLLVARRPMLSPARRKTEKDQR